MERHTHLRHPAERSTHLLLVRHGRTTANRQRLLQGAIDLPLDGFGLRQAERAADRLAGERVDLLLSSPLARALTTAEIIGRRVGREPVIVPGLREIDLGEFEGHSLDEAWASRPDLAARFADLDDFDVGWPGGERRGRFYDRVWTTFHALLHDHAAERIVVVAHGGVIGAFLALVRGTSPNDPAAYDLVNCGVTHLEVRPDHSLVHRRNDADHLLDLVDEGDATEAEACG